MALKDYNKAQAKKTKKETAAQRPATPTGVACTERQCDGEMCWLMPPQKHPQLTELARAVCSECGWRGWC
ncbi:hypothetical protein LCGC14_0289120 [marine sediment metagenome]|uniref:Uncharacterized protein n=1 Tax=marine sediment metagenome TaxID=412755 RepID=A0A0F9TTT0_9ZZZZ